LSSKKTYQQFVLLGRNTKQPENIGSQIDMRYPCQHRPLLHVSLPTVRPWRFS